MKTMSRILIAAAASGLLAAMAGCTAQTAGERTESTDEAQICTNCGGSSGGSSSGSSSGGLPKKADGGSCTSAAQCTGGYCQGDVCTSACTSWSQCPEGWGCGANGLCTAETSAPQCAAAPAVSEITEPCATDLDCDPAGALYCQSGVCHSIALDVAGGGYPYSCATSADCPYGSYCEAYANGTNGCAMQMSGSWSGWTYTLDNAPVVTCSGITGTPFVDTFACEFDMNNAAYGASCGAGLTCLAVNSANGDNFGCFEQQTLPQVIPAGAVSCINNSQCAANQLCWIQQGNPAGSCIQSCATGLASYAGIDPINTTDTSPLSSVSYKLSQLTGYTQATRSATVIAQVVPVQNGAPAPTSRDIVPPCTAEQSSEVTSGFTGQTVNFVTWEMMMSQPISWTEAESTTYAPAAQFAKDLYGYGCETPMVVWGTGLGANYVYYATCPATVAAVVDAAACDSVIHAVEFSSVSCSFAGSNSTTSGLTLKGLPATTINGQSAVYVEWDPRGSTNG